jgi:hypothetical protein
LTVRRSSANGALGGGTGGGGAPPSASAVNPLNPELDEQIRALSAALGAPDWRARSDALDGLLELIESKPAAVRKSKHAVGAFDLLAQRVSDANSKVRAREPSYSMTRGSDAAWLLRTTARATLPLSAAPRARALSPTRPPLPAPPRRVPLGAQVSVSALAKVLWLIQLQPEGAADSAACNVLVPSLCNALASSNPAIRAGADEAILALNAVAEPLCVWPLMTSVAQFGSARVRIPILNLFHAVLSGAGGSEGAQRPLLIVKHILPVRSAAAPRRPGATFLLQPCAPRDPRRERRMRRRSPARARRVPLLARLAPRARSCACACSTRRATSSWPTAACSPRYTPRSAAR